MAKCTPSFDQMVAARGGKGATSGGGKKMPMKAPPKAMPKGGRMVRDTDKDGN